MPEPTRRTWLGACASAAALAATDIPGFAHPGGSGVLKLGLIGCGGRGTGAVLNALAVDEETRLVAVADLFPERAASACELLGRKAGERGQVGKGGCHSGFDAYRRVIEASDVVLIACAAKFHPTYSRAALEAGRHVFVEKPHAIDPAGLKECRAASDLARGRGLSLMSGLQSRYDRGFQETVSRIHDGAIGEVVSMEENFLRTPYGLYRRKPGMSEIQYQFSNQYHFSWLSGDDVPQSLVHNLDRATWVLREKAPIKCHGMGGRSSSFGDIYGDVFDHHAVVYEYEGGLRLHAYARTALECYDENSSLIVGTKGWCDLRRCRIEGENRWSYEGPRGNPYEAEHRALLSGIRSGRPVNGGDYMVRSTQVAVMGQLSCYTGKEVTWAQVEGSDFRFGPRPEDCTFSMEPETRADEKGHYPVPVPGVTRLI